MPHLEPFLVATVGEAGRALQDPAIRQAARDFCLQETQHYRTHRRFNDVLLARGYAKLADVEAAMALSYKRLAAEPLGRRLAYAAGFEAMTLGMTRWLVTRRVRLFHGADPRITSFILWHMVEETEHKRVAHDVYCALTPGYWQRVAGLVRGSLDVIRWTRRSYIALLRQDGRWHTLRGRLQVWSWAARFIAGVAPAVLHALVPGHDPRTATHPAWVDEWIAGYASSSRALRTDEMPLVDTLSPTMPVPF
jgi:predicted metal-dependent hydrolase